MSPSDLTKKSSTYLTRYTSAALSAVPSSLPYRTAALFLDSALVHSGWIERETRAQIERALKHGLFLQHLDSERNVHLFPPIFRLFVRLASEYRIPRVRTINERFFYRPGHSSQCRTGFVRSILSSILAACDHVNRRHAENHNVPVNDHYFGFRECGALSLERLSEILTRPPTGITEIGCHPGFMDDEWNRPPLSKQSFSINGSRSHEVDILTSPSLRELVRHE